MKSAFALLAVWALTQASAQAASPLLIVTCPAPKGLNLATALEGGDAGKSIPKTLDPESGLYISHPKKTDRFTLTINSDGTGKDTSIDGDRAKVSDINLIGSFTKTVLNFTEGKDSAVTLLTIYPNESIVVISAPSYFGWRKAMPTIGIYAARCEFSWG